MQQLPNLHASIVVQLYVQVVEMPGMKDNLVTKQLLSLRLMQMM
jgi:hypothetical protein